MGPRAYLLINVIDDIDQKQFLNAMRELEEVQGVDFVDPVIGRHDMVAMVEAPVSVEAMVSEISIKPWIKNVETMQIVSLFEHDGTFWKDVG